MKNILLVSLIAILLSSCENDYKLQVENMDHLFTLIPNEYSGIDFINPIIETPEQNHLINDMLISGAGVGVGDFNNDGLPDLYFTGNQVSDKIYLNKGDLKFEDITASAIKEMDNRWSTGVTIADVNDDGFLDIYVCKYVQGNIQMSQNLLYINNGDLTFTEDAAKFGLADRGFSVQANFFDINNDGFLDMYLLNQPTSVGKTKTGNDIVIPVYEKHLYTDKFYMNSGKGRYLDVTSQVNVSNLAFGLSATAGDFNNDNYPDLYVANDYELPDHLYINQKDGRFRNKSNSSLKHMSNFSMGSDVADYDNDGNLDIMVVDMVAEDHVRIKTHMGAMQPEKFWDLVNRGYHYQYMFNTLQRNNGDGTFSELGHLAGISNTDWSWSALFSDFDNDGFKDLFITNGVRRAMRNSDIDNIYIKMFDSLDIVVKETGKPMSEVMDIMEFVELSPVEKLKNYIFKNNGDFTFSKKTTDWGFDLPTLSFGAAYADLDRDGDVDLIVNNTDEFASVYRNNAMEKNLGNYIEVKALNEKGMPYYGTKVKLFKEGEFWQLVELTNVRGYKSKSDDMAHFGLGDIGKIEKIEVIFPNNKHVILENVSANQILSVNISDAIDKTENLDKTTKLFSSITNKLGVKYKHTENDYDDYEKEVLLPHKMSQFGPGISVGDVDNDGLEDFYVGGASESVGVLFVQQNNGKFKEKNIQSFVDDRMSEDLSSSLFDYDNDGDLDLYVVSGGNEFPENSKLLQDRLYVNDGKGNFKKSINVLPNMVGSGSVVKPYDFDKDGDLDLFVGGRLLPRKYPYPAKSYILKNENSRYIDVTEEIAPFLLNAGLVTSAEWTDFDSDGMVDLAITGEWMPVTILINNSEKFENRTASNGLSGSTGWYYSLISKDFDNDGDFDLVAGNLGLNYKYKASVDEPFEVYSADVDGNESNDIVLGYYAEGELYPVRGKSCSTEQMPELGEKFKTYDVFANASVTEVYGEEILKNALHYKAQNFGSVFIENLGNGQFEVRKLANEAQFSSINAIITDDFDNDGNLDLVIAGNLYTSEIETPRNDAGMGLYLKGNGKGDFEPVHIAESGFFAPNDVKDMKRIKLGRGNSYGIIVANNDSYLQIIGVNNQEDEDDQGVDN